MPGDVTCPECGKTYDTPRGFLSHWGHAEDAAHEGPAPKDAYGELEFSEKHRQRISENRSGIPHTEETKRQISEKLKGTEAWSKGLTKEVSESLRNTAESLRGRTRPDEVVERHAEAVREAWERGAYDGRQTGMPGEENPAYRHGKYVGGGAEYPAEFNEQLREQVRERDGRECRRCGDSPKHKLHIHHIDADKENNDMSNLIALCSVCHKTLEWYSATVQEMAYSAGQTPKWGFSERVVA